MNLYTKAGKEILSFLIAALQIILTTYYVLVLIHSAELFTILYIFYDDYFLFIEFINHQYNPSKFEYILLRCSVVAG